MLSNEVKEQMNTIADGVFLPFVGKPSDASTFALMERELHSALWPLLGEDVLISCYEYALNPIIKTVFTTLYVKEKCEDGRSYISGYTLTFESENEGE